jgi:hypothetical protein
LQVKGDDHVVEDIDPLDVAAQLEYLGEFHDKGHEDRQKTQDKKDLCPARFFGQRKEKGKNVLCGFDEKRELSCFVLAHHYFPIR